jgi:glycosyltransferase involved in cell wall biosynthesis
MKELTIILPFLNEGVEVARTVESILDHTSEDIDIILINDCSDDGFDYMSICLKYKTKYILNSKRCGVARCREKGIEETETKYFLLLDAHMRVYDNHWYTILITALKKEPSTLFCLQSKVLLNICGVIKDFESVPTYGAFIEMKPNGENFLDAYWSLKFLEDQHSDDSNSIVEIPCVLGAGYACNIRYWNSIHGLTGLQNYGLDEQFISLKVWLTGGKCKLIKNVIFGHVYRQIAPYNISGTDIMYNKLLVTKILLPNEYSNSFEDYLKHNHFSEYQRCLSLLEENKDFISGEREYFSNRRARTLEEFLEKNRKVYSVPNFSNMFFEETLASVLSNIPLNIGLFNGKLGVAFIYMLLARKEKNKLYELMADIFIRQIWDACSTETPISFSEGLLGIGWLCEFLYQNQMAVGNPDNILEELDEIIKEMNPAELTDLSFDTGIYGMVAYIYARMVGCSLRKTQIPYGEDFVTDLLAKSEDSLKSDTRNLNKISYLRNLYDTKPLLTKNILLDMICVSKYNKTPICTCIEKLLPEEL